MDFEMVQELRSGTKVFKWLYLFDLMFIGCYFAIMFMFVEHVHPALLYMPYLPPFIINIIVALIFTARSPFNPKKRIFQTILFIAKKDTYVYHPITNTLAEQSLLQDNLIERRNTIETLSTK